VAARVRDAWYLELGGVCAREGGDATTLLLRVRCGCVERLSRYEHEHEHELAMEVSGTPLHPISGRLRSSYSSMRLAPRAWCTGGRHRCYGNERVWPLRSRREGAAGRGRGTVPTEAGVPASRTRIRVGKLERVGVCVCVCVEVALEDRAISWRHTSATRGLG